MGYLTHFIVYVFAMLSVIGLALFVYKKFNMNDLNSKKTGRLHVEEVLNLSARKTLYIINADGEKFLIAGDMERTTLISKLGEKKYESRTPVKLNEFIRKEDSLMSSSKEPVMKNLVKKLGGDIK